jgi:hypothetical protein
MGAEVYADDDVDVRIVNRLAVEHEDAETANLVDEHLELSLPRPYRSLYTPRHRRAIGYHERITPAMAADTMQDLAIVRECRDMTQDEAPAAIQRARRAPR